MAEFKISSPPNFASSHRNTIVLNGSNNFSSLRIEDPKKATNLLLNTENDVCLRTMLNKVPQVNQYFTITDKLGEGTFSKVYKAKLKHPNTENNSKDNGEFCDEFALKYIIPIVKPVRVAKELRFLRDLGGLCNVIPMKACFYHAGHTVIVMPIIEHDKFMDYLQKMSVFEVREYMRNLLISLERVHAHSVIHRDIKPSNFLYNRSTRSYALVDFGLSQSERDLYHVMNNAAFQASNKTTVTQRLNQSESKARKNLNFKFANNNTGNSNIHINNNNNNEAGGGGVNKLIIKVKRSFDEIENKANYEIVSHNDENAQQSLIANNKNKRAKFFEDSTTSSVFISPITPGYNGNHQVLVPSTPVKVRTPLAETDINQLQSNQTTLTPCIQSLVFETPTKNANSEVQTDVHKTPIKSTLLLPEIPETPPKTIQKKFMFNGNNKKQSQSASVVSSHVQLFHRKENIQKFSTPKVTKPNANRFNSKKILHPELSNVASRDSKPLQGSAHIGGSNFAENSSSRTATAPCDCVENASICYGCLTKPELNVPRAGTPGFRAPEILLRCQNQSTKIDIWSCGVIFASLLSGRYPFFRSMDDMTCLAEIITVIGSSKMKRAAAALGKTLVISQKRPTVDFKEICGKLRDSLEHSVATPDIVTNFRAPDTAYDLLTHLLDPNPFTRYSASEALSHPFFMEKLPNDLN